MAKLKLQVLAPGRRFVGFNKDGSKRFLDFTPEYCRQQFEANSALIAAGIPVPVPWEHRDDAKPGRLSRDDAASARAKGNAGFVDSYEMTADNRVFAVADVPDESDAQRAQNIKFCSPEIDSFTDGTGKDWGEVFTHIALTPRPIQHDQQPITRLSLTYAGPIRLSVDPEEGKDMAEEKETKEAEATEEDGGGAEIKDLVAALGECGFNIPEEATTLKEIIIAIKACGGMGYEDEETDEVPENVGESRAAPMQMSLQKANDRAEKIVRKDLDRQIDGLLKSGRISPPIAQGLKTRLGKVRLSFNKDGDPKPTAVATEIEAYQKLPAGCVWRGRAQRVRLSAEDGVGQADPPQDLRGEKTDVEVLDAWDKT